MNLKDKVVVITGASKGLGKTLAEGFAKEGAKIVLGSRSEGIITDVTDEKQVINLANKTIQKYGRIDIWINNAGIWKYSPLEDLDWKGVREMMEINFYGLMYGSKEAFLQMKKQKSGFIINILSTAALEGKMNQAGYVASKHAAAGFTKTLRMEAKPDIQVIAVYPGGMQTELFREKQPAEYEKFMSAESVAQKIIENLKKDNPEEDLMIKRPK